jgi:hypothetical protein
MLYGMDHAAKYIWHAHAGKYTYSQESWCVQLS